MVILNESDGYITRRSILRNLTNDNSMQNDDEAERSHRRRTLGKSAQNSSLSIENQAEDEKGLHNCLKIFYDNKISKDNVWSLPMIDNMSNLCRGHHKTLKNFQIVGSSLEASAKIYSLRVDCVHKDILRMSSGLGRMRTDQETDDNNDNDHFNNSNGDDETTHHQGNDQQKPPPVKKKRAKKAVSTVTKNKDTLNARLEINQMPDALFYKLNSVEQQASSMNIPTVLLSTLETKVSNLKLTPNDQFWDDEQIEPLDMMADEYEGPFTAMPMTINSIPRHSIRQHLSNYKLSDTPILDDEPIVTQLEHNSFNMSECMQEYAFDMAAGIEPVPDTDHYEIDFHMDDDGGGDDFVELTQEDHEAINACKLLRRKQTLIEDLSPADATKLEYSYRPLDNINQFWAGPSYWKFRKSRKLTMHRSSLASTASGRSTIQMIAQGARRRKNRPKAEPTKFTTLIESTSAADQNSDDDFISIDSRAAQKFKKSILYKRWDSKKLKLPTDLHVDRNLFSYYTFCPSILMVEESPIQTPVNEVEDGYDYDHVDNGFSMPTGDGHHDFDDISGDHMMDHTEISMQLDIPEIQQISDSQNTMVGDISHRYEGAPQMVQKIDILFAKRAKVIDMKQMKTVCFSTIEKQFEKTAGRPLPNITAGKEEHYRDGAASFGIIYNSLPYSLTKAMAENLTPSVAFYSILHLANEHRLRLYKSMKENDMNIFLIRQLEVAE